MDPAVVLVLASVAMTVTIALVGAWLQRRYRDLEDGARLWAGDQRVKLGARRRGFMVLTQAADGPPIAVMSIADDEPDAVAEHVETHDRMTERLARMRSFAASRAAAT